MHVTYALAFDGFYYVDFYRWQRFPNSRQSGTECYWLVPQFGWDCT